MNTIIAIGLVSLAYVAVAASVFLGIIGTNEELIRRKFCKKHPERYPVRTLMEACVISIFWPLQLIVLFMYVLDNRKG